MKKIVIVLLFFCIFSNLFADDTKASIWLRLDKFGKQSSLAGFVNGIHFMNGYIASWSDSSFTNKDFKYEVIEYFDKIVSGFFSENIDFWVSGVDTFYLKKSNENVPYYQAFFTVIEKEIIKKSE